MTGRILIADPVAVDRIVLKVKLAAARYEVVPATSGAEALRLASAGEADIAILEADLGDMSGEAACRLLRADPQTAMLPVILVTGEGSAAAQLAGLEAGADDFLVGPIDEMTLLARVRSLLRAREAEREFEFLGGGWLEDDGLMDRLLPPIVWSGSGASPQGHSGHHGARPDGGPSPAAATGRPPSWPPARPKSGARPGARPGLAEEQAAYGAPAREPGPTRESRPIQSDAPGHGASGSEDADGRRIALLVPGGDDAHALKTGLARQFGLMVEQTIRDDALGIAAREDSPDVFVIDVDLGGRSGGLRLLSELRSRPATRHAAFVVLLPAGDSERAATALDLGASDACHRPVVSQELAIRIRTQLARKRRSDRLRSVLDKGLRLAAIDPLTGLHNRRYGLHQLQRAVEHAADGRRIGVILMDLDHFKAVNDAHGHAAGDSVLARVAQELRLNLRAGDLICRLGGEEFLSVLGDTTGEQLRHAAERLRAAVEALTIPVSGGADLRITISLGTALLADDAEPAAALLERADRALYAAKHEGRNRVSTAA